MDDSLPSSKIALVHDWIVALAGGEKVLEAFCELFNAPIYTLLYRPSSIHNSPFKEQNITSSFLQKLPLISKYYRHLFPVFPKAIESFDLSSYDLILSSSHCAAKGVKKRSDALHICYCHTPVRYAWDLCEFYLSQLDPFRRFIAAKFLKNLRTWDARNSLHVDYFIANSHCVAKRILEHYGKQAEVIYPPVDVDQFVPSQKRENYYVTCSRLVPYKRIDLLVEAFNKMKDKKLIIIGEGPQMESLQKGASKNIEFTHHLPRNLLVKTIQEARAFLFAAEEDFGIVTVEAQAAGIPIIAYGAGGSLETVLPGQTGLFFKEQTASSLIDAIARFERMEEDFQPETLREHALKFSKGRFKQEISSFVQAKVALFSNNRNKIYSS